MAARTFVGPFPAGEKAGVTAKFARVRSIVIGWLTVCGAPSAGVAVSAIVYGPSAIPAPVKTKLCGPGGSTCVKSVAAVTPAAFTRAPVTEATLLTVYETVASSFTRSPFGLIAEGLTVIAVRSSAGGGGGGGPFTVNAPVAGRTDAPAAIVHA